MTARQLGPVACGTVVCADADELIAAYGNALDLQPLSEAPVPAALAMACGQPELAKARSVLLGADPTDTSTHWLRLVEVPGTPPATPMRRRGWMALEVLVHDVQTLYLRLHSAVGSAFTVLGPPRPLSVSDAIWAMQVAGPAGEVLYLTEVRAPVPPFELPAPARHTAERLFIPVLSAPRLDAALPFYEALCGASQGLRFASRVSALNGALGLDAEQPRPVAVLQLAQRCLIEIDEVPEHPVLLPTTGLPGGLAMVSLHTAPGFELPAGAAWNDVAGGQMAWLRGTAGEWLELLRH